ncbi:MAG TPA: phosphatase PAP2 family protein [Polyangiaceae bacterium]|nr:phosphatase PAP2 family protein [Polyangiaceae bacterium]
MSEPSAPLAALLWGAEPVAALQRALGDAPLPALRLAGGLGGTWGIVLAAGLGLAWRGRRAAYGLLGAVAFALPINMAIAFAAGVERPEGAGVRAHEHVDIPSFPSGHVVTATVLSGYACARYGLPAWAAAAFVALVGFARLALGMHFVADLPAGAALGALLLAAYLRLWPRLERWLARRPRWFFSALAACNVAGVLAAVAALGPSPTAWQSVGITAGASVGLLAEHRLVRYEPARAPGAPKLVALLAGAAPALAVASLAEQAVPPAASGALAFALSLWLFAVGPALYPRLTARRRPAAGGARAG